MSRDYKDEYHGSLKEFGHEPINWNQGVKNINGKKGNEHVDGNKEEEK